MNCSNSNWKRSIWTGLRKGKERNIPSFVFVYGTRSRIPRGLLGHKKEKSIAKEAMFLYIYVVDNIVFFLRKGETPLCRVYPSQYVRVLLRHMYMYGYLLFAIHHWLKVDVDLLRNKGSANLCMYVWTTTLQLGPPQAMVRRALRVEERAL